MGRPDCIQCSQEFVNLLLDSGKGHWAKLRGNRITVKDKGTMSTYWLIPTATDLMRFGSHYTNETRTETMSMSSTMSSVDGSASDDNPEPSSSLRSNIVIPIDPPASKPAVLWNLHGLVEWNVNILKAYLIKVAERRQLQSVPVDPPHCLHKLEDSYKDKMSSLQEVQEFIRLAQPPPPPDAFAALTRTKSTSHSSHTAEILDERVPGQLRSYIYTLANTLYRNENPFHNFQHATHVTMSVVKLMSRIVITPSKAPNDSTTTMDTATTTYGITSDPLIQFAALLSALIHDADHPGVSNRQLIEEKSILAVGYQYQSMAELNSLDLAWNLLMNEHYQALRNAIYTTESEFLRFRQLMVNFVLATDIMDEDLRANREKRWSKAFGSVAHPERSGSMESNASIISLISSLGPNASPLKTIDEENDHANLKATVVLEHIIQACDVAHTMQHWKVYLKWNESLFRESYLAYQAGRSSSDPCVTWYQGEIEFFDSRVIPLAQKLKSCGVFGVSSGEYLRYAETNRKEWELRGREIVVEMSHRVKKEGSSTTKS